MVDNIFFRYPSETIFKKLNIKAMGDKLINYLSNFNL